METCTVETGLLKKKPCAHPAVAHCANCEQPLCKDHAVAQAQKGTFMCKECHAARRAFEKNVGPLESQAKPAPKKAEAPKPEESKPETKKPEEKKPGDGGLDFEPSKK